MGDTLSRGKIKERILRVLLNNPSGELTKYRVAKLTESGFSWVHEYLKQLEQNQLISGTKVLDYRKLIETWVSIHKPPRRIDYAVQDPEEYLRVTNLEYVLTTYRAEALTQGYLFPSRTDLYIKPSDEEAWGNTLSNKGLKGKGNFRLLVGDKHVFYASKNVNKYVVVSKAQLILDLVLEGGVCTEAANMLIEKEVKRLAECSELNRAR